MNTSEIWPSQWWWPKNTPVPPPLCGEHRHHAAVVHAVSATTVKYEMYHGMFECDRAEFLLRYQYLRN